MKELIEVYMDRLINRTDVWYRQKDDGGYICVSPDKEEQYGWVPVTPSLIKSHLAGTISCGWPANDAYNMAKWFAYDFDKQDGQMEKVAPVIEGLGWHYLISGKRPGRPGHYRVFFDEKVSAEGLQILDRWIRQQAGIPAMKDGGAEFFPKPTKEEIWMSQLRGPLGVHLKPEANRAVGWFEGPPQDLREQLLWLKEQPLNSDKKLNALLNLLYDEERKQEARTFKIIRAPRRTTSNKYQTGFYILDYVDAKQVGNHLEAQCPLCADEGRDTSKDNLHITVDGKQFGCWQGFWNQVHNPKAIIGFLTR